MLYDHVIIAKWLGGNLVMVCGIIIKTNYDFVNRRVCFVNSKTWGVVLKIIKDQ